MTDSPETMTEKWLVIILGWLAKLPYWPVYKLKFRKTNDPDKGRVIVVTYTCIWFLGRRKLFTDVRFEDEWPNEFTSTEK